MKKTKILIFAMLVLALASVAALASCVNNSTGTTDTTDTSTDTTAGDNMATLEGLSSAVLEDGALYVIKTVEDDEFVQHSLTVDNFGTENNCYVLLTMYGKSFSQVWRAIKNEDGTYSFENMASLLDLTLKNPGNFKKEKKISAALDGKNDNAKAWNVYTLDGTIENCVIENTFSSRVIDIKKSAASGDIFAQLETYNGSETQRWRFEKVSDGDGEYPYLLVLSGDYKGSSSCPEIIYHDGVYYNYNMTGAITVKTSTDLINWTKLTKAALGSRPSWLADIVALNDNGVTGIWAPGAYKIGDKYFLYYCSSSSGSQNSCIGVAVTTDPSKNDWQDLGLVLRSYAAYDKFGNPQEKSNFNAIDPNVFIDDDGTPYLVYGSYWDGIFMRKLDPETGKLDEKDTTVHHLAKGDSDMEAPYLIKRGDYYYLFVARGGLKKGTYYWAVGRSESLFGPYVDKDGKTMLSGAGGTRLTSWKNGVVGVAHAQPFVDQDGTYYMVSESWPYRDDEGSSTIQLHISKMVWTEDGWPVTVLGKNVLRELGE